MNVVDSDQQLSREELERLLDEEHAAYVKVCIENKRMEAKLATFKQQLKFLMEERRKDPKTCQVCGGPLRYVEIRDESLTEQQLIQKKAVGYYCEEHKTPTAKRARNAAERKRKLQLYPDLREMLDCYRANKEMSLAEDLLAAQQRIAELEAEKATLQSNPLQYVEMNCESQGSQERMEGNE